MPDFVMNGYPWQIYFVNPSNPLLVDRTGKLRVATTDPSQLSIFLSDALRGDFLITVLIHELGHCALFSFNLMDDIHRVVEPVYWYEAEEWICNFIANYGRQIFDIVRTVMGNEGWRFIPHEIEKLIGK